MKTKTLQYIFAILSLVSSALISSSCSKGDSSPPVTPGTDINSMKVPAGFTFETSKPVGIKVTTLNNADVAVPNIRINILTDFPENGGSSLISGVTDANGIFSADYKIAQYYDSLVVGTTAIGFPNFQKVSVAGGSIDFILGGKQEPSMLKSSGEGIFKSTLTTVYPLGTYNSNGVPNYLVLPNDIIDNSMISDINATLPEYISLPSSHPQYFAAGNEPNLVLDQACDVWVTFVHEGAGYRNVLGFYKYNTNNPPANKNAIDSIFVIFPNASFAGSGGGLTAGNKVYLGQFAPGTEIAWVMFADGFRNGTITPGNWTLYSDKQFNPETNPDKKKHTILCNDIGRGKFLLSFEDVRRDGSCDNDFNDAVFYVTSNPIEGVNTSNIPLPNYTMTDSDGDGISNNFDDYPSDASRAFNNYYPSSYPYGTLAFEDLWPAKGDYDCNDMVIDYHFNQITNGQNKAVQIQIKLILKAMGAGFENGFGIQLPISPSQVASVTGTELNGNMISLNSNGTEAGQTKATIIAFNNGYHVLPYPGSGTGVNTSPGAPYVTPDTIDIVVTLAQPISLGTIGLPPYNPFLFVNQDRGREIHMVNDPPTDLADLSLFGTGSDDSNPASGRYYVTSNNLPWVMDIVAPFDYPFEKTEITQCYTKFIPWGESGGQTYFDWFKNKAGYRNQQNLYSPSY
jgi:LruC domain-containing protein